MENDVFTHWEYSPAEDYELAAEWVHWHGRRAIKPDWLPRTGFVICQENIPVLMFFMYFDPSCTAAFVDWVITRPKQRLDVSKNALVYALHGPIRDTMIAHGADTVITRSPLAMARYITKVDGWVVNDTELMSLSYQFSPEEEA